MKLRFALVLSVIVTLFVVAADLLAFCTGWCQVPASILGAPGSLVTFAASQGLFVPAPQVMSYVVTFLAWFFFALLLGFGMRKGKEA